MDAVIFDMDGVILVDTEQHWHDHEREFFAEIIDADIDPQAILDEVTGMYFREMYDALAQRHPVTVDKDAFVARFHEMAERVYAAATLMDGFHDLADDLESRGVPVAVATSSPHRWIETVEDRFGLSDHVRFVLSAEDIEGPGKPDPAIYEDAAARLGVDPAACVAVEDSLNGARSAAAAGMHVIAYAPHDDRTRDVADETVASPDALRAALDRLC